MWLGSHLAEWARVKLADRAFPKLTAPELKAALAAGEIDRFETLARMTALVAAEEVGKGEVGGNNMGPDVARYLAPAKPPLSWCAGCAGWCMQEAAHRLEIELPFRRSLNSKELGKRVAAVGRRFDDYREARAGDLWILHRGAKDSDLGHTRIVAVDVTEAIVDAIEGNSTPKVRRKDYDPVDEAWRHAFFASLRR